MDIPLRDMHQELLEELLSHFNFAKQCHLRRLCRRWNKLLQGAEVLQTITVPVRDRNQAVCWIRNDSPYDLVDGLRNTLTKLVVLNRNIIFHRNLLEYPIGSTEDPELDDGNLMSQMIHALPRLDPQGHEFRRLLFVNTCSTTPEWLYDVYHFKQIELHNATICLNTDWLWRELPTTPQLNIVYTIKGPHTVIYPQLYAKFVNNSHRSRAENGHRIMLVLLTEFFRPPYSADDLPKMQSNFTKLYQYLGSKNPIHFNYQIRELHPGFEFQETDDLVTLPFSRFSLAFCHVLKSLVFPDDLSAEAPAIQSLS